MPDAGSPSPEDVVAGCLDALERGDVDALERACREHPDHEARLRATFSVMGQLRSQGGGAPAPSFGAAAGLPESLGRFSILREIARGGSGIVYLARDPTLDRLVAIKALATLPTPETLERFRREVHALTRVRHRNIAAVFDVGQTEQGVPWFAMEYVEGRSLQAILQELTGRDPRKLGPGDLLGGAVPSEGGSYVTTVVRMVRKLADALEEVHRAGVIHRDVKPANILVDRHGELRLVDFGLARDTDSQTITRQGLTPGTPLYMAPEQIRGEHREIDRRADVYALGVTAYQCLALRPPFTGRTTEQLFVQITGRDPVSLRHLNPSVPRDLETIVHTAMQRQPERRYASAAAMRDDLQALLELRPIRARAPGSGERLVRWGRRRPLAASLVAAGVLLWLLALSLLGARELQGWQAHHAGLEQLAEFRRERAVFDSEQLQEPAVRQIREGFESQNTLTEWERIHRERRADLESMDSVLDDTVANFRKAQALASLDWLWLDDRPLFVALAERAELARRQHDPQRESTFLREAFEVAGERRLASWYRARVPLACNTEGAIVHLFRYQPYCQVDPNPSVDRNPPVVSDDRDDDARRPARLVPVPVTSLGDALPAQRYPADFLPGDECLLVMDVAQESAIGTDQLAPGDLITRVGGRTVRRRAVYVTHVVAGGRAEAAHIEQFDIVESVNGQVIDGLWAWETVPRRDPISAELVDDWVIVTRSRRDGRAVTLRTSGALEQSSKDRGSDTLVPTASRARRAGAVCPQSETLESRFGVEVSELEELLQVAPPEPVEIDVIRDGRMLTILWSGPLGATVERTAYPLMLMPENRVDLAVEVGARLAPGSYLAVFTAPERVSLRLPFVVGMRDVERGEVFDMPVARMLREEEIPEGFVQVPAGRWLYQGDPDVVIGEPGREMTKPEDFFIGRYEVSMGEWFTFVNEVAEHRPTCDYPIDRPQDDTEAAATRYEEDVARAEHALANKPVPRHSSRQTPWCEARNGEWLLNAEQSEGGSPVIGIENLDAIHGFLQWKNAESRDWEYLLPTVEQWEKAARGVDGRLYVWGDTFDPTLCNSQFARGDQQLASLLLEPCGRFPTDESVYGVRDMAGSAVELNGRGKRLDELVIDPSSGLVDNLLSDVLPGPVRWTAWRGGSWVIPDPLTFRATSRWPGRSDMPDRGLRLVAVRREGGGN